MTGRPRETGKVAPLRSEVFHAQVEGVSVWVRPAYLARIRSSVGHARISCPYTFPGRVLFKLVAKRERGILFDMKICLLECPICSIVPNKLALSLFSLSRALTLRLYVFISF